MAASSMTEAFSDDRAAQCYLNSAPDGAAPPKDLLPPRKWVQALYLTDGGRLKVSAKHLARLLDVSDDKAKAIRQHLAKTAGNLPALTIGFGLLSSPLLKFLSVGVDTRLVGLGQM